MTTMWIIDWKRPGQLESERWRKPEEGWGRNEVGRQTDLWTGLGGDVRSVGKSRMVPWLLPCTAENK